MAISEVECLNVNVAHSEGGVALQLKIEPAADTNFTDTYCAHCVLFPQSPNHDSALGPCSGPTGGLGNIVHIDVPETTDASDQQKALEATLNQASCGINSRNRASNAVSEYLIKRYRLYDDSPTPLYGRSQL